MTQVTVLHDLNSAFRWRKLAAMMPTFLELYMVSARLEKRCCGSAGGKAIERE